MARILRVSGKSSDMNDASLEIDGKTIVTKDGYVPCVDGIGGGDYYDIEIDLDTGTIVGFKSPTTEDVTDAIKNM